MIDATLRVHISHTVRVPLLIMDHMLQPYRQSDLRKESNSLNIAKVVQRTTAFVPHSLVPKQAEYLNVTVSAEVNSNEEEVRIHKPIIDS